MADYTSDGVSKQLQTDLGTPTLAAGDRVFLGRGNQVYDNAVANTMSGTDLLLVEARAGWNGDFPDTAPLNILANRSGAGRLRMNWAGQRSHVRSINTATGVIYGIEQDAAAGGAIVLSECDVETYALRNGVLHALSTADINKFYASNMSVAHLYASGPTMAECIAAAHSIVNLHRAATLIGVSGNATLHINEEAIAPTNAYLWSGKIVYGGGNMTNLYLYGGTLDLTKSPGPITVTNRYAYAPTRILLKSGMPEPTWTNKPVDVNPPIIEYI